MQKQPATFYSPFIKSIFNNAVENNILLLNSDGIILTVNKAFCNNFGYAPADLRGQYLAVLFTEEDQVKGLPERELRTVLETGQGADNNYLVSKDKTRTWVSGESVLSRKGDGKIVIVKMIQNIHQQKEAEHSLKSLFTFNEDILKAIKDAVVVLNEQLTIIKANDAFTEVFHQQSLFTEAMDFSHIVQPYDTNTLLLQGIKHTFQHGEAFQKITLAIQRPGSADQVYEVSGTPMTAGNGSKNILLAFHDITLQKQLDKEREDILGFVAHEVRTPLANLGLCNDLMDMLLKAGKNADVPDILQRSKNNITRLNKMIAAMYNATRAASGNIELEIKNYHFGEMIKEAVDTIKALHPAFDIATGGSMDYIVAGDRYRMIEVVTNYLTNAIKYSNGNNHISLNVSSANNLVTVAVKDSGSGIPAAQLPFIFERFYRAQKTRSLEGLGLGLYLCRMIIQAHKGKAWAESEEGKGSVFYFSVPLQ